MAASAADAPQASPARFRGLLLRVVSAVVLGPLLLAAVWFGFPWIDLVAALCAPLMIGEWLRLTRGRPLARGAGHRLFDRAPLLALLWLRHQPALRPRDDHLDPGLRLGDRHRRLFHRLATPAAPSSRPSISPSKTWSGLVGGMCCSAVVSAACGLAFDAGETLMLAVIGARHRRGRAGRRPAGIGGQAPRRREGQRQADPGPWRRARPHRRADRRARVHRR